MIRNYILVALRQLYKQKGYNLINILGLSLGLIGFIFAMLFAGFKFSYDKFHDGHSQIYRVISHQDKVGQEGTFAITPAPLSKSLEETYPQIESAICMKPYYSGIVEYEENKFRENRIFRVEEDFFDVFPYKLLEGNVSTALNDPKSVVLTKSIAEKYFGGDSPLGKTMKLLDGHVKVTGVIEDPNPNSIMQFKLIAPIENSNSYQGSVDDWSNYNFTTFIRVAPNTDMEELSEKLYHHFKIIDPDDLYYTKLIIQSIAKINLYSDASYDVFSDRNGLSIIYGLTIASLFLLIIGCVNFVNLLTARAEKRSKEISVRKVFGSSRKQIILQFFGEAFLHSFIAFFVAMIVVEQLHPSFNEIFSAHISLNYTDPMVLLKLFGILLAITLISGSYPALFMSALKPIQLIRGAKSGKPRGAIIRKSLVVFQMIITVVMIISAITISKQISFLKNTALGFDKDNIITRRMTSGVSESFEDFKAQLLQNPNISHVSAVMNMPDWQGPSSSFDDWEGNESKKEIRIYRGSVGYDYCEILGLEFVEGRPFSKEFKTDLTDAVIVNEKAVEAMEMKNPIGKRISINGEHEGGIKGKIIGVIKDYHYNSPRNVIEPFAAKLAPHETEVILVKYKEGKAELVLEYFENLWNEFDKTPPFDSRTMKSIIDNQYRVENIIYTLTNVITILILIISGLGLVGLIAYTTENKIKEIGIRKVLGGTIQGILYLIYRQFMWLLLIANIIGWPLAFILNKRFLENFEQAIRIDTWIFALAAIASVAFTTLIIFYQTRKAARQNPVVSLKCE